MDQQPSHESNQINSIREIKWCYQWWKEITKTLTTRNDAAFKQTRNIKKQTFFIVFDQTNKTLKQTQVSQIDKTQLWIRSNSNSKIETSNPKPKFRESTIDRVIKNQNAPAKYLLRIFFKIETEFMWSRELVIKKGDSFGFWIIMSSHHDVSSQIVFICFPVLPLTQMKSTVVILSVGEL